VSNSVLQFVVAFLGGGASGSMVAWWLESQSEHKRWLRDQKLQAAAQFLHFIYDISGEMIKIEPSADIPITFLDRVTATEQTLVQLISPRSVIEAAKAITASVADWVHAHRNGIDEQTQLAFHEFRDRITKFTTAVRADLKTDSDDNPKPQHRFKRNPHLEG
jgi:hypothetical protein